MELTDSVLIHRFLAGDERSFRALYQRHTPRLRMIVARLLGPRKQETEDALQDTWLAAARGIHTFRGEAKFSTWLTTIAIRAARARLFAGDGALVDFVDATHGITEQPNASRIDLERAIERLADHQRIVLVLFDVEGFSHQDIARQLGIAVGTSKATLSRARTILRGILNGDRAHAV